METVIEQARDALTVKRVYGEPVEREGIVVIPAASIRGGAGAGSGRSGEEQTGSGGGFGLMASPAGAFVVREGVVRWMPAIDVNRIVFMAQIVAIVFLLTIR